MWILARPYEKIIDFCEKNNKNNTSEGLMKIFKEKINTGWIRSDKNSLKVAINSFTETPLTDNQRKELFKIIGD